MSPSPLVIPAYLLATTIAVRLAARFLSQTKVEWNHCFGFGILLVIVWWALTSSAPLLPPGLPFALVLVVLCLPFVLVGTWYFSTRAVTEEGKPGGWLNGLNITAGTVLFSALVVTPAVNRLSALF